MTHDGPQDFLTAYANNAIYMESTDSWGLHKFGSPGLSKLIKEQQEQLVVHIHGHVHDGAFTERVPGDHSFPIINPGSLNQSEYGILTLVKRGDNNW